MSTRWSRPLATTATLSVLIALLAVAQATAKSPPKGVYECTIGGIYADTVKIVSATKYKRFGKTGKFKAGKKLKNVGNPPFTYFGYSIKFKTGPFKGFKGNWRRDTSSGAVVNEIALRNPLDGFEDTYCDD